MYGKEGKLELVEIEDKQCVSFNNDLKIYPWIR